MITFALLILSYRKRQKNSIFSCEQLDDEHVYRHEQKGWILRALQDEKAPRRTQQEQRDNRNGAADLMRAPFSSPQAKRGVEDALPVQRGGGKQLESGYGKIEHAETHRGAKRGRLQGRRMRPKPD